LVTPVSLGVCGKSFQTAFSYTAAVSASSIDVRRFSSRGGGAAGSIIAFAQPVESLSCAGSCTCAPHLASLVPSCTPLLTPLHAGGLSLSILRKVNRFDLLENVAIHVQLAVFLPWLKN
jgi:hypothetical protein